MNRSEIFTKAHGIAKQTVRFVGNYLIAFSFALKEVYRTMSNTANRLIESGLKIWEKNGKRRIYINDLDDLSLAFPDLKVSRYKTGNISSAKYKDEKISNSKAKKLIDFPKMYFDCLSDNWVNATDTAKEVFGI